MTEEFGTSGLKQTSLATLVDNDNYRKNSKDKIVSHFPDEKFIQKWSENKNHDYARVNQKFKAFVNGSKIELSIMQQFSPQGAKHKVGHIADGDKIIAALTCQKVFDHK